MFTHCPRRLFKNRPYFNGDVDRINREIFSAITGPAALTLGQQEEWAERLAWETQRRDYVIHQYERECENERALMAAYSRMKGPQERERCVTTHDQQEYEARASFKKIFFAGAFYV